ncbi:MAG TPA: SulP family inorganic anion transporter [Roseomonas sp.]|jgi:MFS superfamily sulfate permease-like transporter
MRATEDRRTIRQPGLFRALRGGTAASLARDVLAGLTLAAITIPEQMATARLGGFEPQIGFYAFIGATIGFAILGASRVLTAGADSTITPIFAGALAALAASGGHSLGTMAVALAFLVGAMLLIGGTLRLGWLANLLSTPVITGFLAGIALHILVSQLPALLGIAGGGDTLPGRIAAIATQLPALNPFSAAIGFGVLAIMLISERISARIPGALAGVALATLGVLTCDLEARGVAVLGTLPAGLSHPAMPTFDDLRQLVPLALLITLVIMMQTATVSHSFGDPAGREPDVDRDFLGLGAGNLAAALCGAFPVNASPPRTAVVAEAGGTSQFGALTAAAIVLLLAGWGGSLLAHVPQAALAGVLLFVAQRIFRLGTMLRIARQATTEGLLVLLTAIAIIALPIQVGVAIGIGLSLLHAVWMTMHTRPVTLRKLPGTTVWWPAGDGGTGELHQGVMVVAFQAPLLFANADSFKHGVVAMIDAEDTPPALLILEASGIADIDFTAAQALTGLIGHCRASGIRFAIARLESVRAAAALSRLGVLAALGPDHLFHSVDEAVRVLAPPP